MYTAFSLIILLSSFNKYNVSINPVLCSKQRTDDSHPKSLTHGKTKVEIRINYVIDLHKLFINKEENFFDFSRT